MILYRDHRSTLEESFPSAVIVFDSNYHGITKVSEMKAGD